MQERLNKFLAHAGIGSRRQCEELIRRGQVRINGTVVRDLATKVDSTYQRVEVNGKVVEAERPVYWLVNKPKGYLCTNYDPEGRPLAIDLVPHIKQRVYTVGRLDEQSEGLLLLTNDGDLANRLMHPRYGVRKTYLVQVAGFPTKEALDQLLEGVWLSDGRVRALKVLRLRRQGESTWLKIILGEGKNREIRRMLAKLNHKVIHLKRVAIGPLGIGHLGTGKSRALRPNELAKLKEASDPNRHPKASQERAATPERPAKSQRSHRKNQTKGRKEQRREPAMASSGSSQHASRGPQKRKKPLRRPLKRK